MERMYGCDLFEWILDVNPFSEAEAAELFRQVLEAIAFVHANHAVHADIKPENFMFDQDRLSQEFKPRLVLVDFGSCIFDPSTLPPSDESSCILPLKPRPVQGTTGYCAPEVYSSVYNEKADLFSAGVLLFILLTCEMPFDCSTAERYRAAVQSLEKEGLWRIVNRRSDRLRGVSEEARDLVGRLLEPDPNKRISARQALSHSWFQQVTNEIRKDENTQLKRCKKKDVDMLASNAC
jgi:calcium-dependent protein kinase